MPSTQLTGTMDVEVPEDCPEEECGQIQKVLEESIADSLKLKPENVEVTVDPETGEAKYAISCDYPTLVKETQKVLKKDDFVQNVNKAIGENSENLPEKIRQALEIEHVNPDDQIIKNAPEVIVFLHSKQTKIENPTFLILFQSSTTKIVFHHIAKTPTTFIE